MGMTKGFIMLRLADNGIKDNDFCSALALNISENRMTLDEADRFTKTMIIKYLEESSRRQLR